MTENVTNELIYSVLQKMQAGISELKGDIMDLKMRASAVDEHLAGIIISVSGLNHRMDRFDERLARVERRLDLTDAK
ncbi:hypothetical protein [Blastomonas sp.]|uniref:hypothetical protein n=1 Tax=Blastomonas sp. TaxID=1909299 RepID=UPI003593A877